MNDVPRLARWMFPSTIATLEAKVKALKEENYKVKRENASLQRQIGRRDFLYPSWTIFDWERAYGEADDKT